MLLVVGLLQVGISLIALFIHYLVNTVFIKFNVVLDNRVAALAGLFGEICLECHEVHQRTTLYGLRALAAENTLPSSSLIPVIFLPVRRVHVTRSCFLLFVLGEQICPLLLLVEMEQHDAFEAAVGLEYDGFLVALLDRVHRAVVRRRVHEVLELVDEELLLADFVFRLELAVAPQYLVHNQRELRVADSAVG